MNLNSFFNFKILIKKKLNKNSNYNKNLFVFSKRLYKNYKKSITK